MATKPIYKAITNAAVASFTTEQPANLKGFSVDIAPTLDGVSAVNVVRTGKNLLNDAEAKRGYYAPTADGPSYNANDSFISYDVFLKKGTYCFSTDLETCYIPRYFKGNTEQVVGSQVSYVSFTLSTDTNFKITIRKNPTSVITDLPSSMIEIGNQATTYEPYTATTRTISLGQTVYGGSVTVDEDGECTYDDGEGNTSDLDPITPIETLEGENNIWADTGDILSLTYLDHYDYVIEEPVMDISDPLGALWEQAAGIDGSYPIGDYSLLVTKGGDCLATKNGELLQIKGGS